MTEPQLTISSAGMVNHAANQGEAIMGEPTLKRLLGALDHLVDDVEACEMAADIDLAMARLACIERRLGAVAVASPYLHFLRRVTADTKRQRLAVSA